MLELENPLDPTMRCRPPFVVTVGNGHAMRFKRSCIDRPAVIHVQGVLN